MPCSCSTPRSCHKPCSRWDQYRGWTWVAPCPGPGPQSCCTLVGHMAVHGVGWSRAVLVLLELVVALVLVLVVGVGVMPWG